MASKLITKSSSVVGSAGIGEVLGFTLSSFSLTFVQPETSTIEIIGTAKNFDSSEIINLL